MSDGALLEQATGGSAGVYSWLGLSRITRALGRAAEYAPATLCLVAMIVGVWCLELALSIQVHGGRVIGYMAFGALPNADIIGRGDPSQLWRWVSSGLVDNRMGLLHIAGNSIALIVVGSVIERLYGRLVMLGCLAFGVAAGSLTWMVASALNLVAEPDSTFGPSAGICALVGIMLVFAYRERHHLVRARAQTMKAQAALGIGLMALIGLVVPNVNNVAHAGGLVSGVLVGFVLPTAQDGRIRGVGWRTRTALSIVLLGAAVSVVFAAQNLIGRWVLPA